MEHSGLGVVGLVDGAGIGGEAVPEFAVGDEVDDGLAEGEGIGGWNQERHFGVGGHFALAADTGGHDGPGRGHGFQQGDGEAFAQAGQGDQVAGREEVGNILAKTEELDAVGDTEGSGQVLQMLAVRTVASDDKLEAATGARKERGGLDEVLEAFVGGQPGHTEDHKVIGRGAHFLAQFAACGLAGAGDIGDAIGNGDDAARIAHAEFDCPGTMKLADGNDAIAPVRGNALQGGIDDAGRGRAAFMKRETVGRVNDHRHPGEARGQAPDETGFGGVGVHDLIRLAAQEPAQADEAAQVPNGPDLPADYIQVHQAQTKLADGLLEGGVGSQHIHLPTLCLGDLA